MQIYYLGSAEWDDSDAVALKKDIEQLGFQFDEKAAIGEGAGGAGFETIIEVVMTPLAVGLLINLLYDLAKRAVKRKPKDKGGPEKLKRYRLVVHYDNKIISIDLKQPPENIEIAIKDELPQFASKSFWRADQNGKHWDIIE